MGGDYGPRCTVPASLDCLSQYPSLRLALVGQPQRLKKYLDRHPGFDASRLDIVAAEEIVGMDERPSTVLRSRARTSMSVALEMVRDGRAQACVSAGNTGALMALARHVLKTLPGIDRPAMATAIPTEQGICLLLDLGANLDCNPEHLYQFGVMGSIAAEISGVQNPRVALLNVGVEDIKGNQQIRQAVPLFQGADDLNYQGFIEGDGVFRGEADVVVCDGFVGNILLKSSEGLARMVTRKAELVFRRSWRSRLAGIIALPLLRELRGELMPTRYNGATFLGLQGLVVKSHGAARREGFKAAIANTVRDLEQDLSQHLSVRLRPFL